MLKSEEIPLESNDRLKYKISIEWKKRLELKQTLIEHNNSLELEQGPVKLNGKMQRNNF